MAAVRGYGAFLALFSTLSAVTLVTAGKYSLIAPSSAVAGADFTALLYTYSVADNQQANVTVTGSGGRVWYQNSASLTANSGTNINIKVGRDWPAGQYQLTAAAQDGSFNGSLTFTIIQKSVSIFIQTDKAIYKPSQQVRIRVLVTTPDLKPYNTPVNVVVQDSESHKIMQWIQQPLTMGVAQFVLPLSNQPPLGSWTVKATAANQDYSITFDVAEYTLPRFSVSVQLPSYITTGQQNVSGIIQALYTYKEKVQGTALITFNIAGRTLSRSLAVDGQATFLLSTADLQRLGLANAAYSSLVVEANVTETLTGITQSGTASATISQYEATVTFMSETSDYYKSGLGYTAYIKVSQPDGSLLPNQNLQLSIRAYYSTYEYVPVNVSNGLGAVMQPWGNYVEKTVNIASSTVGVQADGIAVFQMSVPTGQTSSFTLQATLAYKGQTISSTKYVSRFAVQGANNIRIQASGPTDSLKSGDSITLLVSVLSAPQEYFYIVTARGRIVANSVSPIRSSTFDLILTPDYAPQATFLVYANGVDGEIVSDSVTLNIGGALQNKVGAYFQDNRNKNTSQAKPADPVTLQVCSNPTSVVFVLAVDQSVRLLKGGNDIAAETVMAELTSYTADSATRNGPLLPFAFFGPRWGGSSSTQVFTDAGLAISTDSLLYQGFSRYPWIMADGMLLPMAMAKGPEVAVAAPSEVVASQPQDTSGSSVRTRNYFPETWIWDFCVVSSSGCCNITQNAPDSITTYLTSAFSINSNTGLAVTSSPTEFTVFQPFFVTAIVPYSIVRGEEFSLSVIVFNYMTTQQIVSVTLSGSADFDSSLSGANYSSTPQNLSTAALVLPGTGANVQFWIRPRKLGEITFAIMAMSPYGADRVEQPLLVVPEGVQQSYCLSEFLLLKTQGTYNKSFAIKYPSDVVPGSKRVVVQASGDIMSASIQGLDRLVQIPFGCGEQNMITFSPNVFVRRYMDAAGLQDASLLSRTQGNMIVGYQGELTYLRTDGFFSAFGNSDTAGSTWLTAFVLKCFRQAQIYLENIIDQTILEVAKSKLLTERRAANGSFVEIGRVIHVDMQGGSGTGIPLTAFVIISFIEDNPENSTDLAAIQTSVALLENAVPGLGQDLYTLAIVTYALTLSGSNKAQQALSMLVNRATNEGDTIHWSKGAPAPITTYCPYCPASTGPSDIEITSYALLTHVYARDFATAEKIVKWLTKMRNSLGGYSSTQDTVLALQALATYAKAVRSSQLSLNIAFTLDNSEVVPSILIDFSNSLLQQTVQVSNRDTLNTVSVLANGLGSAVVGVCMSYNVMTIPATPTIDAQVTVHKGTVSSATAVIETCAKSNGSQNGMWIVQLMSPSCFVVECDGIGRNTANRVDCSDDSVTFYYYELKNPWTCVNTSMQQLCSVKNLTATYAKVYPYYSPDKNKLVSYNLGKTITKLSATTPVSTTKLVTPTTKSTTLTTERPTTKTAATTASKTTAKTTTAARTTRPLTTTKSTTKTAQTTSTTKRTTAAPTTTRTTGTTAKSTVRAG